MQEILQDPYKTMNSSTKMALNQYKAVNQRIEATLSSINVETKPTIAALAREFKVSETRLRALETTETLQVEAESYPRHENLFNLK